MTQRYDTDRYRQEDGSYEITCVHCKQTFNAKRYDASFCGATCRVGYSRAQAQLKSDIAMIPGRARQIRQLAEKHPKAEGMFEALMKAQAEIRKALEAIEYSETQTALPIIMDNNKREPAEEFFADLALMEALQEEKRILIENCSDTTLSKKAQYKTRIAEIDVQLKRYS